MKDDDTSGEEICTVRVMMITMTTTMMMLRMIMMMIMVQLMSRCVTVGMNCSVSSSIGAATV